jgi:hypothetical protein
MMMWNYCLTFDRDEAQPSMQFSMSDDTGVYTNIHGLPFKTPQEFERHYYMLGDTRMASMWTIVDELEVALEVSSMLEE